jgi:hypothetical protein
MKKPLKILLASILVMVQIMLMLPQMPAFAGTTTSTLIEGNSIWKYNDSNTDLGTSWRTESYNDSTWKSGKGPLGYPSGDSNPTFGSLGNGTIVSYKSSPDAYITYYFRKNFTIADVASLSKLDVKVGMDDGYVMYINGTEVRRVYMDAGEVNWQTIANYVNEPSSAEGTDTADITAAALPLLKNGTNTIAVEMHNRDNKSSDIYFDMNMVATLNDTTPSPSPLPSPSPSPSPAPITYSSSDATMNMGKSASELNFSWYTNTNSGTGTVQIAKKSDMTGTEFPAGNASTFTGLISAAVSGSYSNKVTVTNLQPATEYVYRMGDGNNWSQVYSFTSHGTDQFSFLAVGDPQIGSSGNITSDTAGWVNTMLKATAKFPDVNFLMSAGDQVENNNNESQYTGFFKPDQLLNLPLATALGNHDNGANNYSYHFNQPNLSSQYGVTTPGSSDYYFTYGSALFMVLNSNNTSGATHRSFIDTATKANPNAAWKIVMFHHSIYSSASHSTESSILNLRAALFPIFDDYKIDMVLMGHDHCYTRSYQMLGDQPQKNQTTDASGAVVNPTGTLYMTLNSGSGSKYYDLMPVPETYSSVRTQIKVPTFSYVNVTADSLSISTYRTDSMAQTDTYTISKPVKIQSGATLTGQDGTRNGAAFSVKYGLSGVQNISAQDVTINYNKELFDFKDAETTNPNTVIQETVNTVPGTVRFIIASMGADNAISGAADVLKLNFAAKATGSGMISVANANLSDDKGNVAGAKITDKTVDVVDASALEAAISTASVKVDAAIPGNDPGQYPESAISALQNAINTAKSVLDDTTASASRVSQAGTALTQAVSVFDAAKVLDADKTSLIAAITTAQAIYDGSAEGLTTGQYPAGTRDRLNAAISSANAVRINIATNAQVAQAVTDLNTAVATFKSLVITSKTGDINNVPGYDIGDLGIIAGHYGIKTGDQGWSAIKYADINGDGSIGLYEMAFIARKILGN